MSAKKRACVVHSAAAVSAARLVEAQLSSAGYEVCMHEADEAAIAAAKDRTGNLDPHLLECIKNADLVVFILDGNGQFSGCIDLAQNGERLVVGVYANASATIAECLDDLGTAVVSIDSEDLGKALSGEEIWENPDGSVAAPRKLKRQKCQ